MHKKLAFGYGIIAYLIFMAVFLYTIGFVGNILVPKSIDSGNTGPLWLALVVNVFLISLFGLQHSVMARPGFKQGWTKIVPEPVERSTYVLLASLTLGLVFWLWRPIPAVVWNVEIDWARWLLWGLFALGWATVYISAEMIDSGHLFGLQQVRAYLRGEEMAAPGFQTPGFYRYMRHPLMVGFLIAFWATPRMTLGHLVFALGMTGYILIALRFEERDLIQQFGDRYHAYRERVPMFIPRLSTGSGSVARPVSERQGVKSNE